MNAPTQNGPTTFDRVRSTMAEMFELDEDEIKLDARLFEDLDLDSIDAIDLVARLQALTDVRIDESALRGVRTVGDIVELADSMLARSASRPTG